MILGLRRTFVRRVIRHAIEHLRKTEMTAVASHLYRAGKRADEVPLVATPIDAWDGEFIWIGVTEMANLQARFGLHPLAVEDALNGMQVPKVDVYGNQPFSTLCAILWWRFKKSGWL